VPDIPDPPAAGPRPGAIAFTPAPLRRRHDGWTAERQCLFIETLAETGCVTHAAAAAGMSARSAYRLAAHPLGRDFAEAWDVALSLSSRKLVDLAWRYVTEGMVETVWRDGVLVAERRRPSERLLIYLLGQLDKARFGRHAPPLADEGDPEPRSWSSRRLPEILDTLEDVPPEACPAEPAPPPDASDPASRARASARPRADP
jgi:hypothetical protein